MVDLRMPDLGGLDVLRAIREIDPRYQAVLMTGYGGFGALITILAAAALISVARDGLTTRDHPALQSFSQATPVVAPAHRDNPRPEDFVT